MRYFKIAGFATGLWALGFALLPPLQFLMNIGYTALVDWFPRVFPTYNYVTEHEDFIRLETNLLLIIAAICLIATNYLSVRFDNERLEYMITRTEGMYTLSEGARIYYDRYFVADCVASALVPLPLTTIVCFLPLISTALPETLYELLLIPLEPTMLFVEPLGLVFGYIVMVIISFLARQASGVRAIAVFRAAWLSDVEYYG
ncbi:MAG: hypothetical protein IJW66_02845 [Clostridia bacterium]|nr:hypothetical protein [Clostridia bacterium]